MERKLERLKAGKGSEELGEVLHQYGQLVKQVEGELAQEKDRQAAELEEKLRKRRDQRRAEIERQRAQREQTESKQINDQSAKLKRDIDQIKQLIKPVENEDARMEALLADNKARKDLFGREIVRPASEEELPSGQSKALELIAEEEDAKVKRLVDEIAAVNEKTLRD